MKRLMTCIVALAVLFTPTLRAQAGAPAAATVAPTGAAHVPSDIAGTWQGTLQAGKGLRTILKISKADNGSWKAVMYSIDQSGVPIAVSSTTVDGLNFGFAIKTLDLTYAGMFNSDRTTITGNATQHGQTHVLNLTRVGPEDSWEIPAPPKAMPPDAKPKYEVVTVKPADPNEQGKLFTIRGRQVLSINTSLSDLLTFGYSLQPKEILNMPSWSDTKYDVDGIPDVEGRPDGEQMKMLMQDVLVERFGLRFHNAQREMPVYALTVAKGGSKMTVTADSPSTPPSFLLQEFGRLRVGNSTMKDFCLGMKEWVMDKPVVDQTGLTGRYDFTLHWTPDQSQFAQWGIQVHQPNLDDPSAPPSLYTALQEQLGLKLVTTKAMVDVLVIDHMEKPSPN